MKPVVVVAPDNLIFTPRLLVRLYEFSAKVMVAPNP